MSRPWHFLHHTFRPERYEVFEGMTIGKEGPEVHVIFSSENVGQPHCRFMVEEKNVFIIDLNSGFPTQIRSRKLRPYRPYQLSEGDLIQIGRENLVYSRAFILDPEKSRDSFTPLLPNLKEQFGLAMGYAMAIMIAVLITGAAKVSLMGAVSFAVIGLVMIMGLYFWGERFFFKKWHIPLWNRWAMRLIIIPVWAFWLLVGGNFFRSNNPEAPLQAAHQEDMAAQRLPASGPGK